MPPPNNPSVARVALETIRDSRHFVNTFHIARIDNAAISVSDLDTITNLFADWWLNTYRLTCKNIIVGERVVATKLDPVAPIQDPLARAAPGSYVLGAPTSAEVTAAISWRTGLAGRKFRGRFYHFGLPTDTFSTLDTMVGAYMTQLTQIGTTLLADLAAANLKAVIFHRISNTYTPIVGLVVDQLVDSMRTRLAGRGI